MNKLSYQSSIRDVIHHLNLNGRDAMAFLFNEKSERLDFIFTDGDIRRAILSGISLDSNVSSLISIKQSRQELPYISVRPNTPLEEIINVLESKNVRQVIVLDDNSGQVLEVLHKEDLIAGKFVPRKAALIMAGGFGKRLMPFTENVPKPMLDIDGRPFLEYQLTHLRDSGIHDFYLSVYHLKKIIMDHFVDGSTFNVHIDYLEEESPLGTAGCINLIKSKKFDHLLIINGDIFCEFDVNNLFEFHIHNNADVTMCVKEYVFNIPYGTIKTDGLNLVEVEEKPIITRFINAGIYIFGKNILEQLVEYEHIDITDFISKMINEKKVVKCYPIINDWIDMGTPDDYEKVKRSVLKKNPLGKYD